IRKLDIPVAGTAGATRFPLTRASAAQVAAFLQQFYAQRYPNDANHISITFETGTNAVFVQAAPADLAEITRLIEWIEKTVSSAVNELRVKRLNNAGSDELASVISQAIIQGVLPTGQGTSAFPTLAAQPGLLPGGATPGFQPGGATAAGRVGA